MNKLMSDSPEVLTVIRARPRRASGYIVQLRVIGASIMRELHTRFGRQNIGYLWFLMEPVLLASGITVIHLATDIRLRDGLDIAPFYITGYIAYMMFRSNVNRSTATIDSNRTLLFHKQVTLFDLVISRCLLELAATTTAMILMLGACVSLGLGHLPDRPLLLLAGMGLMFWFTTGLAMIITAASEVSPVLERFVHPATYLILPISGMFFLIEWVPEKFRPLIAAFPLPQITELVREGEFGQIDSPYVDVPYLLAWCAILTLIGMFSLRLVRRRLHLS